MHLCHVLTCSRISVGFDIVRDIRSSAELASLTGAMKIAPAASRLGSTII